jgi:lysyl-tRNA synthetase class 2
MTQTPSPWWASHLHTDRRPILLARNRIREAHRSYFADQGFTEVDCAALQRSPGNETHLHAFETAYISPDGRRRKLYLHTSPEFACKKLLAAGEKKIFSLGPAYRNFERGALHAPEFTMLEWYRADEPYEAVMDDCIALIRLAAEAVQATHMRFRETKSDPYAEPIRMSVAAAFKEFANVDLLSTLGAEGEPNRAALAKAAQTAGVKIAADDSWSDIFSRILVERIEPRLGCSAPTLLDRYPRTEAALARASRDDPRVAERFELYLCAVEIANGFGELTDSAEQRRRFAHEMAEKERIYENCYPIDEDFLAALQLMPEASGVALGFDRLVMLATGAAHIDQVIWTPMGDQMS